jgi:hypothetical protein
VKGWELAPEESMVYTLTPLRPTCQSWRFLHKFPGGYPMMFFIRATNKGETHTIAAWPATDLAALEV